MTTKDTRQRLANALNEAAASYQAEHVIPHCASCLNPCCRLNPLVLELNWKQIRTFWRIEEARASFDKRLATGQGPQEIRAGNGLYYVHGKACPVYDDTQQSCTVYNQDIKPRGCSDFPVYEDGDCLIADLRCEAVSLESLAAWIGNTLGPDYRVVHRADPDFPFMITLSAKPQGAGGKKPRSRKP